MTIDILIPHCTETSEEVTPLLDSIAVQQNISFKDVTATIADDGPGCAKLSLKEYPFKVKHVAMKAKGGVSAARDFAFRKSKADYVMFCDADDTFYSPIGLFLIFQEAKKSAFDYMTSSFVEETRGPDKQEILYVPHDVDFTFVHGKVIRRKFLEDNQISWNKKLTVHEDSYFNQLCLKLAAKAVHCPIPFYLWRWRDASVCRHDPKYILKTFNNMLDSSTELVNELSRRSKLKEAAEIAVQMTLDSYFTMNKREWLDQENREWRDSVEKRFRKYWHDFKAYWEGTPENIRNQMIVALKNRFFNEGVFLESQTFDQWIEKIESL